MVETIDEKTAKIKESINVAEGAIWKRGPESCKRYSVQRTCNCFALRTAAEQDVNSGAEFDL